MYDLELFTDCILTPRYTETVVTTIVFQDVQRFLLNLKPFRVPEFTALISRVVSNDFNGVKHTYLYAYIMLIPKEKAAFSRNMYHLYMILLHYHSHSLRRNLHHFHSHSLRHVRVGELIVAHIGVYQ